MKNIELTVEGLGTVQGNIPREVANGVMMMVLDELRAIAFKEPRILIPPTDTNIESLCTNIALEARVVEPISNLKASEGKKAEVLDTGLTTLQYNPFANNNYFENSRLVAHKCDACGKSTVRRMHLMEDNVTHCHWCKKETRVNTVARVDVQCSSCNSTYYVWTANGLEEIECKDCKAPNDLVYYDNGRKGCTTNLRY